MKECLIMSENKKIKKTLEELFSDFEDVKKQLLFYFLKIKENQDMLVNKLDLTENESNWCHYYIDMNFIRFYNLIRKFFHLLWPLRFNFIVRNSKNEIIKNKIKEETIFLKKIDQIYEVTNSNFDWTLSFPTTTFKEEEKNKYLCLKEIEQSSEEIFESDLEKIWNIYKQI